MGRGGALGAAAQGWAVGGRRCFSLVSGSVMQNEKSHRETPMGLPAGRKRKRSRIFWAFTLGNSQFRCFSQVVSLRGSCYHPLVMKEETGLQAGQSLHKSPGVARGRNGSQRGS